ncbi:MAG: CHASE2 domain-containing protein [Gammaproteobacteria bacterium]|nr:CHASE2 domain-containing protein [Gammaproteobacteria bacterium]
MAKRRIWTSDWFAGVAYAAVFLLCTYVIFPETFQQLENAAYDLGVNLTHATPGNEIAVIAIDDASINTLGRWPWPRTYHADLINRLSQDHAKVIGLTLFLSESQVDPGSVYIRELMNFYDHCSSLGALAPFPVSTTPAAASAAPAAPADCGNAQTQPAGPVTLSLPPRVQQDLLALRGRMQRAENLLNADSKLAASIHSAGNVVIPSLFMLGEPLGRPASPTPDYLLKNALGPEISTSNNSLQPLATQSMSAPQPQFAQPAAAIGFLDDLPDADGTLRSSPLVLRYDGVYYPSMALAMSMRFLNLQPGDIQVLPGQGVKVGNLFIGTDAHLRMHNFYYAGSATNPPFPVYSYADVYLGKIPASVFQGKIVLIGATALGIGNSFPTPTSASMAPVMVLANVVSSILQQDFYTMPAWTGMVTLAALLLLIAYLAFALPQLKPGWGAFASLLLLSILVLTEFGFMRSRFVWIELMLPALLLVSGHLFMTIKLFRVTDKLRLRTEADSAESNKMLGLAFQGQGQLDMAFEKFRKCPMSDSIADLLYNLGLDYERKRQFNKAGSVYEYVNRFDPEFRDVGLRLERARQLEGRVVLGAGTTTEGTLILGEHMQNPMLGRYLVEKELGKGAMGIVYQGRDPKINRIVAIKTLALSREFEADELAEVKQRFFREAETAGRLNHPNIVTIYDAGEEHDLAYISMEYLKGLNLTHFIKPGSLLPAALVMEIGAKAAEALDYADRQNVVHRDVKPANIMYERDTATVKITDFGIARITDSSRTKTGTVLGTPSYMSPEQLAGRKVDGRSDLFSLGVTIYQLLTGKLPFQAESMATLMYKIANERHAPVTSLRPELPVCINAVIDKALQKNPELRYQQGVDFARELRACAANLRR